MPRGQVLAVLDSAVIGDLEAWEAFDILHEMLKCPNGLSLAKHRIEPAAILQTRYRSESTKLQTEAWQQMTCKTSVLKGPREWGYPLVEE